MAEGCVQHIVHLLTKSIIHIIIGIRKRSSSLLRCVQSCRLSCGAGESIWRPCFSSDSCQSPATLQAEFRKQGATFHSRRQLARARLGGQTLISSSSSVPPPLPQYLAYPSTPSFVPLLHPSTTTFYET